MTVHVDDGVGLAQLQRVTDALHVAAVEPHLVECTQHAHRIVHRVVHHMVDERAQRVGVQIDGILLRELAGSCPAGHIAVMGVIVVIAVVAVQNHLVAGIGDDDIAACLAKVALAVIINRVAQQGLAVLGGDERALIQGGIVGAGVVPAVGRVDGVAVAHDERLAGDVGKVRLRVVVEQIGKHLVAVVDQVHVTRELGLLGVKLVATVLRPQLGVVAVIDDGATVKVVAHIAVDFIVQRVGQQRGAAVLQTHVVAQLGNALVAVVVQHVAIHPQGVALRHAHVAKGVERTRLGIEIGAVAEHVHVASPEAHVALEHLVVTADVLVGRKQVGILQEHLVRLVAVGLGNLRGDTRHGRAFRSLAGGLCRLRIGGSRKFLDVLGRQALFNRARGILGPHHRRHEQCHQARGHNDVPPS